MTYRGSINYSLVGSDGMVVPLFDAFNDAREVQKAHDNPVGAAVGFLLALAGKDSVCKNFNLTAATGVHVDSCVISPADIRKFLLSGKTGLGPYPDLGPADRLFFKNAYPGLYDPNYKPANRDFALTCQMAG